MRHKIKSAQRQTFFARTTVLLLPLILATICVAQPSLETKTDSLLLQTANTLNAESEMESLSPEWQWRYKPRPWLALVEVAALNVMVWGFGFTSGGEQAKIDWPSDWWDNLKDGWEWDPNSFTTNFFGILSMARFTTTLLAPMV